ncbi:aminotransferase class V-fold PLP-dependent enzyme [Streptomyces flaveolus]
MAEVAAYEDALTARALPLLAEVPGVRVAVPADLTGRCSAVSFTVYGTHPHDVGQVLDERGAGVRVGHHCARPAVRRRGIPATTRASFSVSHTLEEVDALVAGVRAAQRYFGVRARRHALPPDRARVGARLPWSALQLLRLRS